MKNLNGNYFFFIVQCSEVKQQGELSLQLYSKKNQLIFFLACFSKMKLIKK